MVTRTDPETGDAYCSARRVSRGPTPLFPGEETVHSLVTAVSQVPCGVPCIAWLPALDFPLTIAVLCHSSPPIRESTPPGIPQTAGFIQFLEYLLGADNCSS